MILELRGPFDLKRSDAPRLRHLVRRRGVSHLAPLLVDPSGVIAVEARKRGRTVGWAAAWRVLPEGGGGVSAGVFVSPSHRDEGIGRLLAVAIRRAAARRWKGVVVDVWPTDEKGRRMYAAAGMERRG